MSNIEFLCFRCNEKLKVDSKYIGRKGKCPKCGVKNTVPSMHDTLGDSIIMLFEDIDDYEDEQDDYEDEQDDKAMESI